MVVTVGLTVIWPEPEAPEGDDDQEYPDPPCGVRVIEFPLHKKGGVPPVLMERLPGIAGVYVTDFRDVLSVPLHTALTQ